MQNVVVISYNLTFFCRFDVHFLFFNLNFVENHTYSQKFFNPKYPARRKKNILSSSAWNQTVNDLNQIFTRGIAILHTFA